MLNTGVDVIPTLCDITGVAILAGLQGKSLMASAPDRAPDRKRKYVVSQNYMVQCYPVDGKELKPNGRMVRGERYKYCVYSEGKRRESLIDMQTDPGEMRNLALSIGHRETLVTHRRYLIEWQLKYNDDFRLTAGAK